MRFAVLGPVTLADDAGGQVELGGPRRRVLLAALLLHANQPVSTDVLAEAIWDGAPPPGYVTAVRTNLMRLRRAVGPKAADRISTLRSGYLIRLDERELDMLEFEALCRQAGAAARVRSWALVSDHATRALALWRGAPLADIPSQRLLDAWVPRLDGRYLQAREWRVEAELQMGQHEQVLPEVAELAARHPLREHVYGQLMRALAGCGQRARALEVYRDARRILLAELGVEPGAELRRLQEQILAGGLESGPVRPSQHPAMVPRQLPTAVRHFAGRVEELTALDGLLDQVGRTGGAVVVSAISGTAGIGKTALALHWAHRHAARFPDGQLYVNLRGFDGSEIPVEAATVVRQFLDALSVPASRVPADPEAQFGLFRSLLADRRMLIVLDNARDDDQVRPLLPGAAGCLVLVTSRNRLRGLVALDGALPLTLDLLSREESSELLSRRLESARIAGEQEAVAELIDLCAGLPLALNIAASRATVRPGFPLGALVTELRDTRSRLDLLSTGDDAADIRAVFSWSLQTLSPEAKHLFRLLGVHPGPDITVPAAASLAGIVVDEARRQLDELIATHLLTEPTRGRYTLHDLLRAYAVELSQTCESEESRQAAVRRTLDHYLHTAAKAVQLLYPAKDPIALEPAQPGVRFEEFSDDQQALAWFDAEHAVLWAATDLALRERRDTYAWQIPWTLAVYLERRGHWTVHLAVQQTALAAAVRAGDLAAQADAHRMLARASSRLGSHQDAHAHLGCALELFEQLGDRVGQAHTHHNLGWEFEQQGRYRESLHHSRQSHALYEAAGHRTGQARALNAIGWYLSLLGMHEQTLPYCQQALELHRDLGNHDGECDAWDSLGHAHYRLGDLKAAGHCYEQALELCVRYGDVHQQATINNALGDIAQASGELDAARDAWCRSLNIFDELHHPEAEQVRAKLRGLSVAAP